MLAPADAMRGFSAWVRIHTNFGIVAHLVLAFVAVAALAIAANVLVQHGTLVVLTIDRNAAAPVPVASAPSTVVEPVQATKSVDSTALLATINLYERQTLSRMEDAAPPARKFRDAGDDLTRETLAYVTAGAGLIKHSRLKQLTTQVSAHRASAIELVRIADAQRDLVRQYREHFEAMDGRMKASLDRAWKVFGRIIARESLVELSRHLNDMRSIAIPLGNTQAGLNGIAFSESAFGASLEDNRASLTRSQGAEWVASMREGHAALVAIHATLVRTDEDRRRALQTFSRSSSSLIDYVGTLNTPGTSPAGDADSSQVAIPSVTQPEGVLTEPAQPITSGDGQREVPAAESTRESGGGQRELIAWLSAAVLVFLLAISIIMAMRIIRPVRGLMLATKKFANGDLATRVRRGGIKELDSLAMSFNEMAERLAAAQAVTIDHQKDLEARVDERTRQLQHLAEHDPLTELPNRRQLFSQLEAALSRARSAENVVGVMVLDLDNFKNINDSMGHAYGDRVLQSVAQRLEAIVAPSGFSARLGGDEFTVVYTRAGNVDEILAAGESILRGFQLPLSVDGRSLTISLSIGVSVYPQHAASAEALLRAADAALFRAKSLGRNQMSTFSPELFAAADLRFNTEQGLRHAIEGGEFELAFQPEVNLHTFEVSLVEALLRWRLPDGRLASPADFLVVAEESGLITEISDWVFRSAIEAAAKWHHGGWPDGRVAINVSPRQLLDSKFVGRVEELLIAQRLPAKCIEIELTENVLQTGPATIEALNHLRACGIGIALDDFGTGYSSLASLEQLPLTRVKLDRSLIAGIDGSRRALAIARAIIGLCESLGLEITAEGVERPEQLGPLLNVQSMFAQGYLLSRPVASGSVLPIVASMPARMQSLLLSGATEAADVRKRAAKPLGGLFAQSG